jgi:adenosylmethionine-8-amino-7-oxononanoate aminotransferase
MKSKGLLVRPRHDVPIYGDISVLTDSWQAKPTHQNIIRLAPPLVITEEEIKTALNIITEALEELPTLAGDREDEVIPPPEKKVKINLDD